MTRLACPYCCAIQVFTGSNVCNACGEEVSVNFIKNGRERPPVYLAAVGMTQHGKTTFIESLVVTMDSLTNIAPDATFSTLDDFSYKEVMKIRSKVQKQEAAASTKLQKGTIKFNPLMLGLNGFVGSNGEQSLVIYDLAGEIFREREKIREYAPPIKLAHTIWFFVSLYDLEFENDTYGTISDLFDIYLNGMENADASPVGRNLHVIYTKADKLANRLATNELTPIRDYLRSDPYTNLSLKTPRDFKDNHFDQTSYMEQMNDVSGRLEEFTTYDVKRGRDFINKVRRNNMNLTFSITSSTGRDSTLNNAQLHYQSFRVLDPLIFSLIDHKGIKPPEPSGVENDIALILDASYHSGGLYADLLPTIFFRSLFKRGRVCTYYLGRSQTIIEPGREPTADRPLEIPEPFIGPILDKLGSGGRALLITTHLPRDLQDFDQVEWHRRLCLVTFQPTEAWPCVEVFNRARGFEDEAKRIVQKWLDGTL